MFSDILILSLYRFSSLPEEDIPKQVKLQTTGTKINEH